MKRIPKSGITGQAGVSLIERMVLKMGCLWHPTGGLEAGIDGFIEFRDPSTEEVLNVQLAVQSKATDRPFASETESRCSYICDKADLDYWMQGNQPVILVVSRPRTDEAYWVSIKDYFADPQIRASRKVIFDKQADRLDEQARDRLFEAAAPRDAGVYFVPDRRPEPIYSNLLRVARLPRTLYFGDTTCSHGGEVRQRLSAMGAKGLDEWTVRGKRILSLYDLRAAPWRDLVDLGTVDEFDPEDWTRSVDPDAVADFSHLLFRCLQARLRQIDVRYDRQMDHFYFAATQDLRARVVEYHSLARGSSRAVFQPYLKKDDSGEVAYYRHNAFQGRFREYDREWYLQIDPTYRFTSDGWRVHPYYESKLKGILAQENNPAVRGQVVMWASLLQDPQESTLFSEAAVYPHLGFGALETFESTVGINDAFWLRSDENPAAREAADQASALSLFDAMTDQGQP